jgi:DNA primase
MSIWLVKAIWNEDETESREEWEVNADTAHEAVKAVTARIRFHPHHVEAKRRSPEERSTVMDLQPGEVRRVAS